MFALGSASIRVAVSVSMPRKQRNQPMGSRYGSVCAIFGQPRVELHEASLGVTDRQQIIVDDHVLGRLAPFQARNPLPMSRVRSGTASRYQYV